MAADGSIVFNITADDADAQKKLAQLRRDIERLSKSLSGNQTKHDAISQQLENARNEAEKTADTIRELQAQYQENAQVLSGQKGSVDPEEFAARQQAQKEITYELKQQQALYERQQGLVAKLEGQEQSLAGTIARQTEELNRAQGEAGELEKHLSDTGGNVLPQVTSAINGMGQSLKKTAKFILRWGLGIRSAFFLMRKLRNAIKEGISAFAEQDAETKSTITSLKNSLNQLKVAWGAAFAPILNAVAPILQRLINMLITAANYVQMFFNALRGKGTYKAIVASNNAVADSYEAAGGAADDAKKAVMGFDELNKLDDNSGGGGGGGGGADDAGIEAEESIIPEEFLQKVQWIKDHFQDILGIAIAIGGVLLAWKLSKTFEKLTFFKSLKLVLGILLAILGTIEFIKGYVDAWKNGANLENIKQILGGMLLIVLGLGIAFGTTGAAIGLLVTGIALVVLALHEWITTGEITGDMLGLLVLGIMAVGTAIALLIGFAAGGWIAIVVAAIVALVAVIIAYWDEIKAFFISVWEAVRDWFIGVWESIAKFFVDVWTAIIEWFSNAWETIKNFFVGIWEGIKEKFNAVVDGMKQKWQDFKDVISNVVSKIVEKVNNLKQKFVEKFNAIKEKAQEIINKVKEFFTFKWELPHIKLPHLTVTWEPAGALASFFGFDQIPHIGIQWYAKGGIVDGATLFGAGEAGKEAVVPLERHTEWIKLVVDGLLDELSKKDVVSRIGLPALASGQIVPPRSLSNGGSGFSDGDIDRLVSGIVSAFSMSDGDGNVTKLYLDGREIAECVTKHQRRMERA